jgi:hypothetical protein
MLLHTGPSTNFVTGRDPFAYQLNNISEVFLVRLIVYEYRYIVTIAAKRFIRVSIILLFVIEVAYYQPSEFLLGLIWRENKYVRTE